jgi:hypothetical protein
MDRYIALPCCGGMAREKESIKGLSRQKAEAAQPIVKQAAF